MNKLGDLLTVKHGFVFKGEHFSDEPTDSVLVTPGNFAIGGGFQDDKLKFYDGPIPEDYILNDGDLIITMTDLSKAGDTLGYPAIVPVTTGRTYLHNQRVGLVQIQDEDTLDRRFLYYRLCGSDYRHHVLATASGSTVRHTSPGRIGDFEIDLPPIAEQRRIASILGSLDDKIEHNRRTGQALERLARAIFKAWFVAFEPVKAKAEGATSFPSMPQDVFDALPTTFVETEIGPVPEGWGVVDVYDLATVHYGAPFKSNRFNDAGKGFPLIRIRDLKTHEPAIFTEETHPKGRLVHPSEIVVGMDGEFRLHYWTGPKSWLNQRVCLFEPLKDVPPVFVGESLRAPLAYFENAKTGTTVIHLGKSDIDTFRLVSPPMKVLGGFSRLTTPILQAIVSGALESRRLSATRDYLLPKLMSGELALRTSRDHLSGISNYRTVS